MSYNFKTIKEELGQERILELLYDIGAEPIPQADGTIICKTICHGGDSHKLYYYPNEGAGNGVFVCYTRCEEPTFDIFELISRVKQISLFDSLLYIANFFGLSADCVKAVEDELEDWEIIRERTKEKIQNYFPQKPVILDECEAPILFNLPSARFPQWELEGISPREMALFNIKYNPANESIVIPHYDIDNRLVGIRERTLIKEDEVRGKYKPAIFNTKMYNHPLSLCLYGLNRNKEAIKSMKKVVVCESEKSVLMYGSYFGQENNICVATCGSNLSEYQLRLLMSLGVEEIIIAFDRQYKELGDEEHSRWVKKLRKIHDRFGNMVSISFMFDKKKRLEYKMSPLDAGPKIFMELFKERIFL